MKRVITVGSAVVDVLVRSNGFRVMKSHLVEGGVAMCEVYGGKLGAEEISTEVPDEAVSHDEKLGKGSISGLEGDAKVASDIRTVKDLWRQIEEDEI